MLDLAHDIRSLSDFTRNTVDLLDRIRALSTRDVEPGDRCALTA
jgi:hypothetical protein